MVYISKIDVLTENSLQVLEKQDSWRVGIPFVQAADIVGGGGGRRADFGPLSHLGDFNKEVILGFMQKCLSYQALFLIPVYLD